MYQESEENDLAQSNDQVDGGFIENDPPPQTSSQPQSRPKRIKPTQVLPTDRLSQENQWDILRAYPALSGPDRKPVKNAEVADLVGMNENTVSLSNAFFVAVELLERQDGGLVPSAELFQFLQAYEWDKETAAHKLAPYLRESWFAKALLPKLSFGPMGEDKAIAILGEAATAGPAYKNQLKCLIHYLETVGIVERDNGSVKLVKSAQQIIPMDQVVDSTEEEEGRAVTRPAPEPTPLVQQVVIQEAENLIRFQVAISIDMKEIAKMSPERIAAFFNGIAEVMKAKGIMESQQTEE